MTFNNSKFQDLILSYSQESNTSKRKELEDNIWHEFGKENTVLVLDMSGFSLLTRKYGIVHYLSMVRRMQLTAEPIILGHGGKVIKFEADNCFAVFPSPLAAIRAAISMQHSYNSANLLTTDDLDIHISIGIDYGKILIIDNEDIFGDAVNRACKMGEDIGTAGEILVSKEALDMVPGDSEIQSKPLQLSIGGINISAFSILYLVDTEGE